MAIAAAPTLASSHLAESLARYQAQGGPYERLMTMFSVQLPESLLRRAMGLQLS